MSLPAPINWMEDRNYPRFAVFGFNRSNALTDWWAHRTPDHTQRFFYTLEDAENWVKENHKLRGFSRDNSGQSQGELISYHTPSSTKNTQWLGRVELIQEKFGYGKLVKWYGSMFKRDDGKNIYDKAVWWIFRLQD